jgi:UDP-N-acetylglucosamine---dolichyl-phosphate N-acetylglucosaminyltransferase
MDAGVFVIIPAYNEQKTLRSVLRVTKKYCDNIIVVDDGSIDKTFDIALNEDVIVLQHIVNLGKGSALKTGCEYAISHGAKKIVIMDADGQHNPVLIPKFVRALDKHMIVYGYREFNEEMPVILAYGNRLINYMIQRVFAVKIRDSLCGFRAWTKEAHTKIRWKATDYYVESEIIAHAAMNKLSYTEIPIPTVYLDRYKGTTPIDGIKIIIRMLSWRFV